MRGYELVDGTARLAAMNLLLHGMGTANGESLIDVRDSLIAAPQERWSVVLSNPPFGKKSSVTKVGADGRQTREKREIERQDFVATSSNKQLNFIQHIAAILDAQGVQANVLFFDKKVARPDEPWTERVWISTCAPTSTSR